MSRSKLVASLPGALFLLFMAGSPARADLVVSSFLTDNVLRYDAADGSFLGEFVGAGSGGLDGPRGVAFSPHDGALLVASSDSDEVLRYDGVSGAFLGAFVSAGSGGLNNPFDIRFGPDDNLYVASAATSEVLRYDGVTGAFLDVFASSGPPDLNTPRGLLFANGTLWVSGEGDRVWRFDEITGAIQGSFIEDNPRGLALGPDANIFVSTNVSNQVNRHDGGDGSFLDIFVTSGSGGLASPFGLVFGGDGLLYVCSRGTNNIKRFNAATGAFVDDFTASGDGGLSQPHFLTFTPAECFLVVGSGPGVTPFSPYGHTFWTQLADVRSFYPVQLGEGPAFPLPSSPAPPLASGTLVSDWNHIQRFSVQVVMWNPWDLPHQPEQWTSGLNVRVHPTGSVFTSTFGSSTGMQVWAQTGLDAQGQPVVRFPFSIPGF